MTKVAILGSSGLLGSALARFFQDEYFQVIEVNRSGVASQAGNQILAFDVLHDNLQELISEISQVEWIVNATGVIKHKIDESSEESIVSALKVNSIFPGQLEVVAASQGKRIITVGTDCVFRGLDGVKSESTSKDATDIYGISKIYGELAMSKTMILRSSFVGVENGTRTELLEWVRNFPADSIIEGFENHFWNGVTVLQIGKVIKGIIETNNFKPGIQHLVPRNEISKFELISEIMEKFRPEPSPIVGKLTEVSIDRVLATDFSDENLKLWRDAGYSEPPSIEEMISEYADWVGNK